MVGMLHLVDAACVYSGMPSASVRGGGFRGLTQVSEMVNFV